MVELECDWYSRLKCRSNREVTHVSYKTKKDARPLSSLAPSTGTKIIIPNAQGISYGRIPLKSMVCSSRLRRLLRPWIVRKYQCYRVSSNASKRIIVCQELRWCEDGCGRVCMWVDGGCELVGGLGKRRLKEALVIETQLIIRFHT